MDSGEFGLLQNIEVSADSTAVLPAMEFRYSAHALENAGLMNSQEPEVTIQAERYSRFQKVMNVAKRVVQSSVIATEVSPLNGAIRYGACFGATLAVTHDPFLSAAALGGSTLILEGSAALATADVLSTEKANKAINFVNKGLDHKSIKKYLPSDKPMSPATESIIALYGGTSILLTAKKREDPEKSHQELRKHGMVASACLTGICAVQGFAIAEGITSPTDLKVVVPATVGLAGLYWATRKIKQMSKKDQNNYQPTHRKDNE